MQNFKELIIWNQGIELAVKAYHLTKQLPKEEVYGLSSQIKRAAVSIPSNIAEGCSRSTRRDFTKYLRTSLGSAYELETDLIIAAKLLLIEPEDVGSFIPELVVQQKRISSFISKLS